MYTGDRLKNVQVSRIYEHSVCTKEGFWKSEEVNEEDLRLILLTSDIFKQVKEQLENMSLYRVMSMIKCEIYFMRYGVTIYAAKERIIELTTYLAYEEAQEDGIKKALEIILEKGE